MRKTQYVRSVLMELYVNECEGQNRLLILKDTHNIKIKGVSK